MGEGTPGGDVHSTLTISAFQHMIVGVQRLMDEGVYAPGDPTTTALELWTFAHGIAALLITKPYLPWGDVEEFTDRVMRAVCTGQIVTGMLGQDARPKDVFDWLFSRGGQPQDE
jgi:Tetracyclin repressor-like, C-terminal domain